MAETLLIGYADGEHPLLDGVEIGEPIEVARPIGGAPARDVVFLGSYPRADLTEPTIREGTSNAEYAAAETWLRKLRG